MWAFLFILHPLLFGFQLHLAALGSLRGEISELHARLQRAAQDRETLEQALAKTQVCIPCLHNLIVLLVFFHLFLILLCTARTIAIGAGK